jgi:hypothetical protein
MGKDVPGGLTSPKSPVNKSQPKVEASGANKRYKNKKDTNGKIAPKPKGFGAK